MRGLVGSVSYSDTLSVQSPPGSLRRASSVSAAGSQNVPEVSDEAWEAAAQARRRAGAKPRVRRTRRTSGAEPSGEESPDSEKDGDESPNSMSPKSSTASRKRHSIAGLVNQLQFLKRPLVSKRQAPELVSAEPLPEVAQGFENLGAFVQFHREHGDGQGVDSRSNSKAEVQSGEQGTARPMSRERTTESLGVASRSVSKLSREPENSDQEGDEDNAGSIRKFVRKTTRTLSDRFSRSKRLPVVDDSEREREEMERLMRRLEEEEKANQLQETLREFREACRCDDVAFVKRILAGRGASPEILKDFPVDHLAADGVTSALVAARCGHARLCAALLDGKADPLARDRNPEYFRDGIWPIERHAAAGRSRYPPIPGALPGMTVVYHLRLMNVFEDVMELVFPMTRLSIMRAIATALHQYYKKPPAVVAARYGNVHLLALFLTHSATVPPTPLGEDVTYWSANHGAGTPMLNERAAVLLMACTHRQWRCAEVVIAAGVSDVSLDNTQDPPGRTALHLVSAAGESRTARLLLKAGASTTVFSGYGRQPIHDAAASGHLDVAKALVDRGADHLAKVREGKPGIPWKQAEVGLTAVELAEQRGFKALGAYLRDCHRTRGLLVRPGVK